MALKLVADFQHKYSVYFGQSVDWLVKKEDMSSKKLIMMTKYFAQPPLILYLHNCYGL